jgi:nucleoside 2-deoxyribosyltransferase
MRIYLASSWKNRGAVLEMASLLRKEGHIVDAFCEEDRVVSFNWSELFENMDREGLDITEYDAVDMMDNCMVQDAFMFDKEQIDLSDAVIMMLPCGRSSHMEAGYAVGRGKKLYIVGGFEKGEFDVMYGFATGMYDYRDLHEMLLDLRLSDMNDEKIDKTFGNIL